MLQICNNMSFYLKKQRIRDELTAEKDKEHKATSSAFVIFKSLKAASLAMQCRWDSAPIANIIRPAPEVNNVIWGNLSISLLSR